MADIGADDFQGEWDAGRWRELSDDHLLTVDFGDVDAVFDRLTGLDSMRLKPATIQKLARRRASNKYTLTAREWAEGHTDTAPDAFRLVASHNI
jgi:hypothetical protein